MISVVIPLFNSEIFIAKAIDSALIQQEVSEVIVINDGSTDNSLKEVFVKQKEDNRIKVYSHFDQKNHGRSASRNLGINKATSKYIAFLDADDFYLPDRFTNDKNILDENSDYDGVYNAISAFFYRSSTEEERKKLKLTTIRSYLEPEELFYKMGPIGHYGYFSGIGLTVRKSIFDKIGFFNEKLEVAEDTELWIKMALCTKLVGGKLDQPVALRGVHDNNTSFKNTELYDHYYLKMYVFLFKFAKERKLEGKKILLLWTKIWEYRRKNNTIFIDDLIYWWIQIIKTPVLMLYKKSYSRFPLLWRLKRIFS